MQYRKYGKLGYEVSALGMGCMRLPLAKGSLEVDKDKAFEMLRYACDSGINYFDTAFLYHHGTSESVLGEALEGERREKVKVVTKQPLGVMKTDADIRKNLESTLKKLRTSYIDVYLVHNINPGAPWEEIKKRNVIGEWEKFKKEGLIRSIGFSYHGDDKTFVDILNHYDWDMAQIQQNFIDVRSQATEDAIGLIGKKGAACVIMEPLLGGSLASPPPQIADIYNAHPVKKSSVEWAFRHLLNYPEVSCILSGMSTLQQVKDNIALFSAKDAVAGCLSPADKAMLDAARAKYKTLRPIPCTGCEYCMPCPNGIGIPNILSLYNDMFAFGEANQQKRAYMFATRANQDASSCVKCGECEKKCPQGIDIMAKLEAAHAKLAGWVE